MRPHTAVITCGFCKVDRTIALGLASAITCSCGCEIVLGEAEPILGQYDYHKLWDVRGMYTLVVRHVNYPGDTWWDKNPQCKQIEMHDGYYVRPEYE